MSPDTDPPPSPDIWFQRLRGPLDALAAQDFATANESGAVDVGHGMDDLDEMVKEATAAAGERDSEGEAEPGSEPESESKEADEAQEPFVPLGSEDPVEEPGRPVGQPLGVHTAIARSLQAPAVIPRVLRKEARSFFDGAMYAYTEGDLAGARLTFLAVAGIGDADTAPAAMVFLGVIAYRHRDIAEARMWFTRAAAGADEHWARVAAEELRRLG